MTLRTFSRLLPAMAMRGKRQWKQQAAATKIKEYDFAEEFSTNLPSMAMLSSSFPDSSQYASLQLIPVSKINDNDGCDIAHCSVGDSKKLEHAPPGEPMPQRGSRMVDLWERPPVVFVCKQERRRSRCNSRTTVSQQCNKSDLKVSNDFI
jgi:hypothetical protein